MPTPDADCFDLRAPRPAKQLVFGGGIHYCLGAALSRVEISEALAALTQRFDAPIPNGRSVWRLHSR
ncbi:hypothetical protein [Embleya sp. MST-111070]|uniref:hypothetical protein n=1 Tax=Embleya sp. MST-111070 TaxID=3398231 RepID=UPI003F732BFC